jgi:translation initiation factor 1A
MLPSEGELVGVVTQLLGFDRVKVKCSDGKTRICRIPGKMKKKIWLRLNDIVLVAPWDFQSDQKGDIVWRYDRGDMRELKARGYLDMLV